MKAAVGRQEFNFDGACWLLHCAEGPTPVSVAAAARRYMDLEEQPWNRRMQEDVIDILAAARKQAAAAISLPGGRTAEPDDISLSQSTSSALTTVARGYPFQPGDEVLAPLGEFPSNVWPWKGLSDRGVSFREVPLWDGHRSGKGALESTAPTGDVTPELRIADAIGPRTRIVTASWVRFQDGLKLDLGLLGRLCRERGVPLVIDGIQGAGAAVPDLTGVSAFATGGHKGLLGMSGQGFLWTDPDFRMALSPLGSWLSVDEGGNFNRAVTDFDRGWQVNGHRLEQGGFNIIGSLVLGGSLGLLNTAGIPRIQENVRLLQGILVDGLLHARKGSGPLSDPRLVDEMVRMKGLVEAGRTGPILSLHHHGLGPEFLAGLAARLHEKRIFVSTREGYLRMAMHAWHDMDDVMAVLEALA